MNINYLIAYDITEAKRLNRVHYFISKRATALQRSVFLINGDSASIKRVSKALLERADTRVDDIRLYPLQNLDRIWVAGKQAEILSGLYPGNAGEASTSFSTRFIRRLFGAKK